MMRELNKPVICIQAENAYGTVKVVRFPGSTSFQVAMRFPLKCEEGIQSMKEMNLEMHQVEESLQNTHEEVDALSNGLKGLNEKVKTFGSKTKILEWLKVLILVALPLAAVGVAGVILLSIKGVWVVKNIRKILKFLKVIRRKFAQNPRRDVEMQPLNT